jgi:hypothetical protein
VFEANFDDPDLGYVFSDDHGGPASSVDPGFAFALEDAFDFGRLTSDYLL